MKMFRLFLAGVLILLATVSLPATAQAAGESIGYLPLLSRVDPNVPVRVQSQRALDRIAPKLLALQKDGAIVEFEPELSAGVLKVKYSGATGLSSVAGIQTYGNIHDAMARLPQAGISTLNTTPSGPIFLAELYDSCFQAAQLGAFSHVVGSLHDTTDRVLASYEGDADGSGNISLDCFSGNGSFSDVVPGYWLTFKVYDTTPTLVGTYIVRAPSIQFASIDNVTSVVGGAGPGGKHYDIFWSHPNLDAGNTAKNVHLAGTISSAGKWSKDFGATKFRGGDDFAIMVQQSARFAFLRFQSAPYMYCQLGGNYCDLHGIPFQPATLSITHAGILHTFTGKIPACGCFLQALETNGKPIYLQAGDQVSGTSVPMYILPNLTANVNFSTNVVSGKAPPNKSFELWVNDPYIGVWYFIWSHSNSLGNYAGDFTSQVDLVATQAANIEVYYQSPSRGNVTDYYRSIGP